MALGKNFGIFISYARRDGADLAQRLQRDLAAQGFDPWLDTQRLGGSVTWTTEIERAIDRAQVVLALITPGSYLSEICRSEQLRSLRKGKCVIPLLAQSKSDIPLHLEAKQYRDFTGAKPYGKEFSLLLQDITGRLCAATLKEEYRVTPVTYVTTPPTVVNYVERPEALRALRDALFADHGRHPLALIALAGMGGIGKTVLAHALTRDPVVQDAFPDGIVWITVGREKTSDLVTTFREVGKSLRDDLQHCDTLAACINQYKTALAHKSALIILDDIWKKSDLDPFLADSNRSQFLFTTRDASIARFTGAREYMMELLSLEQARELLAAWANIEVGSLSEQLDVIIEQCGNLPLALSTVGAMLRGGTPDEWHDVLHLLCNADLSGIRDRLPPGQESFFRAIEISFQALVPEMQRKYTALAVLLEDMAAPPAILKTLWEIDDAGARQISRHFVDRSLALQETAMDGIRLHDLQLDYVRAQYADQTALDLIHGAVRLSSHVIDKDPGQFASQLLGRLFPRTQSAGTTTALKQFIDSVKRGAPRPCLFPLVEPTLIPPGTSLVRTLIIGGLCYRLALSPDARVAISSHEGMVWDLETGRELATLIRNHEILEVVSLSKDLRVAVSVTGNYKLKVQDLKTGTILRIFPVHRIKALLVNADATRAITCSTDKTLKIWDLETGHELRTLVGHSDEVNGLAVTDDWRVVVSASRDQTLKAWDLETGRLLCSLAGHSDSIYGVGLSANGHIAVSASKDTTLKVWDMELGCELHTLVGHSALVESVAVSADGRLAISASWDKTLKLWDLSMGQELRTLVGHSRAVRDVKLSGDGRIAASVSTDDTLRVWDLSKPTGQYVQIGHSDSVQNIAISADGRVAVSASKDPKIKVWDVETTRTSHILVGHSDIVTGVAISSDGRLAVTGSDDKIIRIWNLQTGDEVGTLIGHSRPISAVALSADGTTAVSASWDKTLKVWDVKTGCEVRTLIGHPKVVTDVALSDDGWTAVSSGNSNDGNDLKVWDLRTGHSLKTLVGQHAATYTVAISGDGRRVVSYSDDLRIWDLKTGRMVNKLETLSRVRSIAVSTDGRLGVVASDDKTIKVWDLETSRIVSIFTCDAAVRCCALSTTRRIIAGDQSGRIHFLSLEL